jgi:hypothetical protein
MTDLYSHVVIVSAAAVQYPGALCARGYHRAVEERMIPLSISMPPITIFVLGSLISGIVRVLKGG